MSNRNVVRGLSFAIVCSGLMAACSGVDPGDAGSDRVVGPDAEPTAEVSQASTACVTLRRGSLGSVSDTQIASDADKANKNYGAGLAMIAGAVSPGSRRTLIKFDMSAIPAGATIDSASVTLQARANDSQGGPGNVLSVHSVTSAWSEGSVTWNTAPTFGGAIASDSGGPGAHAFDVTSLAQGWMGGSNGGLLLQQSGFYRSNFTTSEDPILGNRPKLDVCYTQACAPGLTACGASCYDVASDETNCGSCGFACDGGTCSDGVCVTPGPSCAGSPTLTGSWNSGLNVFSSTGPTTWKGVWADNSRPDYFGSMNIQTCAILVNFPDDDTYTATLTNGGCTILWSNFTVWQKDSCP